jgi:hypothetical protein
MNQSLQPCAAACRPLAKIRNLSHNFPGPARSTGLSWDAYAAGWLSSLVEPWPAGAAAELPRGDGWEGWHRGGDRRGAEATEGQAEGPGPAAPASPMRFSGEGL